MLPSGDTAENMKEACQKMEQATGHKWSAESFRTLVRKEVDTKIKKSINSITKKRDASEHNTGAIIYR